MNKIAKKEYIYGISPCLAAILSARRKIYKVYLNEKLQTEQAKRTSLTQVIDESQSRELKTLYKSRSILDRLSGNRPHQNVVMHVGKLHFENLSNERFSSIEGELVVALDKIQDPMNFGAIIRTAYYFGVNKMVVSYKDCCGLTPVVSKASAGAMEWMPVHAVKSMKKFLQNRRMVGWDIIGTTGNMADEPLSCHEIKLCKPSVVVLGNEGFGMDVSLKDLCTKLVTIPPRNNLMSGDVDSLNVSVATGILLHTLTT